jgi:hypothetical protein
MPEDVFADMVTPEEEALMQASEADETQLSDEDKTTLAEQEKHQEAKQEAEPEPEPEKEPEKAEEPAKEPEKEEDKRTVPLAALHEERDKRKELQGQMDRFKQDFVDLKESLKPKEPEPEPIDYNVDPIGATKQKLEALEKVTEETHKTNQEMQQFQEQQRIATSIKQHEDAFKAQTPDYDDAFNHIINLRTNELKIMGYNDQQIADTIAQGAFGIGVSALQQGKNPAQVLYEMAKNYGYKTPEAEPEKKDTTAEKTIEELEKGQEATKKVGAGEAPKEGELTLAEIMKLDGDEFDKAWDKYQKSGRLG